MNNDRNVEDIESMLRELGEDLRHRDMPGRARRRWRDAVQGRVREDAAASNRKNAGAMGRVRPWLRPAAFIAAALVLALVVSYAVPSVTLYAGSLPGVGSFFRLIGADRGLQLASDQGVAADVNLAQTVDGVRMELVNVVADTSRTALGFQISAPEGHLGSDAAIVRRVTDQWGRVIPGAGASYRISEEDGRVTLTGVMNHDGLSRMTRFLNVEVESIGAAPGPWTFRVPVSYASAVSHERVIEVGARSEERAGVSLEVSTLELHATEVVVTYVFHGLEGPASSGWHGDTHWQIPGLYTSDGERILPLRTRPVRDGDGPLAVRVAYEPLPEGTRELKVIHEAVALCYSAGPHGHGRNLEDAVPSFTFQISGEGAGRAVDLSGESSLDLWGTRVEIIDASITGSILSLGIRGTGGDLVGLVGWSLTDDGGNSVEMANTRSSDGWSEDVFEYVHSYRLDGDVDEVTLEFFDLLRRVEGPWEVQFSLSP